MIYLKLILKLINQTKKSRNFLDFFKNYNNSCGHSGSSQVKQKHPLDPVAAAAAAMLAKILIKKLIVILLSLNCLNLYYLFKPYLDTLYNY